jgi:hypothetical protein
VHGVFDVADAQAAFVAAPEPLGQSFQPRGMGEEGLGLGQEGAAVARQADALLAALEQRQAQPFLQLGDLPAQRRLGDVQRSAARPTCSSSATATKY